MSRKFCLYGYDDKDIHYTGWSKNTGPKVSGSSFFIFHSFGHPLVGKICRKHFKTNGIKKMTV